MLSRRRCGKALFKVVALGIDGVGYVECELCRVFRLLGLRWKCGEISIGLIFVANSMSSLLSDCTKGLVGAFKMKLDE